MHDEFYSSPLKRKGVSVFRRFEVNVNPWNHLGVFVECDNDKKKAPTFFVSFLSSLQSYDNPTMLWEPVRINSSITNVPKKKNETNFHVKVYTVKKAIWKCTKTWNESDYDAINNMEYLFVALKREAENKVEGPEMVSKVEIMGNICSDRVNEETRWTVAQSYAFLTQLNESETIEHMAIKNRQGRTRANRWFVFSFIAESSKTFNQRGKS